MATGLRYSYYAQLKREHIRNNVITLVVKKTKTELTIPLNSMSASVLDKYKDDIKPLPVASGQNLKYSIKDLCKLAGIDSQIEIVRYNGEKRNIIVYPEKIKKSSLVNFLIYHELLLKNQFEFDALSCLSERRKVSYFA
jgi:integrase